tara:strand:+ start:2992 stop:3258 length:267 start_codon:yes stop_codon:yes gene_type:complete
MKISRMKKGEWSKIRAFFDLETDEGFNIKGFKLIEGIEGMFVGFPSQKNKDGEYQDTIFADKTLKQQVNKLALDFYSNDKSNDSDVPF